MIQLKFKKTGHFADEDSARYEAVVNENIIVRVFKDGYFEKGFVFEFFNSKGYPLNSVTTDFRSSFWSKATKKQAIKRVNEIVNDSESLQIINNHAIYY